MSVFTELHRALYERLKNSLSVEVYDYVPDDAEFPFVNVGELNSVTLSTKDGKSVDLYEVTSTIHVFSRRGKHLYELRIKFIFRVFVPEIPLGGE